MNFLENEKLNKLVIAYKSTKNDFDFSDIYTELLGGLHRMNVKIAKSIGISPEDVIALYQDTLLRCIEKYNGGCNFRNFFNASVKRARVDALRRRQVRTKFEMFYEDLAQGNDESEAATFDIASDFNLEETVISKEADQRQLIDFLLKDPDEITTAIVKASMTLPKVNPMAIEKTTGICRKKVKRKFEKLASKFDSKQFGEYQDYLVAL